MFIYIKLTDLSYHVSEKSYVKWNTKSLCRERGGERERERELERERDKDVCVCESTCIHL